MRELKKTDAASSVSFRVETLDGLEDAAALGTPDTDIFLPSDEMLAAHHRPRVAFRRQVRTSVHISFAHTAFRLFDKLSEAV